MKIKGLQISWDKLGKVDPLWAVLSDPRKKGGRWPIEEFFATGEAEVRWLMDYVASQGVRIRTIRALDFGCGVGRLTQALAQYFDEVIGVDIAPSMLSLAREYNHHGDKCRYRLNDRDDLQLFPENYFDLIYSNITLQHIEPRFSLKYIKEFLRTLAPSGVIVFQLPSELTPEFNRKIRQQVKRVIPASFLNSYYRLRCRLGKYPIMEMHAIKAEEVLKVLTENGGKVLNTTRDDRAGDGWISYHYCVTKPQLGS